MRPDIEMLEDTELDYTCPSYVKGRYFFLVIKLIFEKKLPPFLLDIMADCWSEWPESRPDFTTIRNRMKTMRNGMKTNIMDQMVEMLEKYSNNLEVCI